MIIVVTGTNTDVGKTIAVAALASRWSELGAEVGVVKPAQTGEPEGSGDAPTVTRLTGVPAATLARFPEPLAPNISARRAGMPQLALENVAQRIAALDGPGRITIVEGAGGLLVRLGEDWTVADLAARLDAPVVVVTSMELGSLNVAELTVEACRRRGLTVPFLIGGSWPAEPDLATELNREELTEVTGVPLAGVLPAGSGQLQPREFPAMARRWLQVDIPAGLR